MQIRVHTPHHVLQQAHQPERPAHAIGKQVHREGVHQGREEAVGVRLQVRAKGGVCQHGFLLEVREATEEDGHGEGGEVGHAAHVPAAAAAGDAPGPCELAAGDEEHTLKQATVAQGQQMAGKVGRVGAVVEY
jgi:hypothetical protein